ncbi:hypothetical protein [Bosea sp. Leaf344]|uniref:hypothetical protein n=1 Tax=Bosea sp. Leaf344 TaxID=1736346 RepID=UPI000A3E554C|nr:hypothetical protein [Bosea sp. Leaf344]
MALRSLSPSRLAAVGLVLAGAMAATTGGAAAQFYEPYDDPYPRAYVYRYGEVYDGYYGRRLVPPRVVNRIAARDYGLVRVDRTIRTGSSQVIDGVGADGSRLRLIFDARTGAFLDRIVLKPAKQRERVARIDPRSDDKPVQRLVPSPPERPAALKPPAEASAPATIIPPAPAAPARAEPPQPAAPAAPAQASAPATVIPPAPAAPARAEPPQPAAPAAPAQASAPATTVPASPAAPDADAAPAEPKKPRVVYPSPIPAPPEPERAAPLAKAPEPEIPVPAVGELPPVQIQDLAPTAPKPETPAIPVAPME